MSKPLFDRTTDGLYAPRVKLSVNVAPFKRVELPTTFRTNWATVPKWAQRFVDPDSQNIALAAAIHDGLVGEHGPRLPVIYRDPLSGKERKEFLDWDAAAVVMRNVMHDLGAPPRKRFVVYWAVRLWGKLKELKTWTL